MNNIVTHPGPAKEPAINFLSCTSPTANYVLNYGTKEVQHTFQVTNRNNFEVEILGITTSCGCTTVSFPTFVKPLETVIITLKVDLSNKSGYFGVTGKLRITDHITEQWLTLAISGELKK